MLAPLALFCGHPSEPFSPQITRISRIIQSVYRGRSEVGIVSVLTRFDSCKILIRFMGTGGLPRSIRGSHPSSPFSSMSELRGLCDTLRLRFLRPLRLFAANLPSSVPSVSSCKILPCVSWATSVRLLLPLCPSSVASVRKSVSVFLRLLRLFAANSISVVCRPSVSCFLCVRAPWPR